jgi:hypothetical protein
VTQLVIRQDATSVEITEVNAYGGAKKLVYYPDGTVVKTNLLRLSPRNVSVASRGRLVAGDARTPAGYTSKWKDGQLVSAITAQVPGEAEARRYEETILLGADGNLSVRIQRVGSGDSRTL